jgi:hypothetical protein
VPGCQRDDQVSLHGPSGRGQDQPAVCGTREGRDGALDLSCLAHVHWTKLYAERRRRRLNRGELTDPAGDL